MLTLCTISEQESQVLTTSIEIAAVQGPMLDPCTWSGAGVVPTAHPGQSWGSRQSSQGCDFPDPSC